MNTPFEFDGPTGLTLLVDLFATGNDTPVTVDISVTEATNRKMTYGGVIAAAVDGSHKIHIKDSAGAWLGTLQCSKLKDTTVLQFFTEGVDLTDVPDAAGVGLIVIDILTNVDMVAGVPIAEALRRIGGVSAGILVNAGSGTETVKDWANSAKTMVCIVDEAGNRSSWVFN